MEQRNEPSTEEVVRALRRTMRSRGSLVVQIASEMKSESELLKLAAGRLESLTREIEEKEVKIEQLELQRDILAGAVKDMEEPKTFSSTELIITDPRDEQIAALTARAERAEREWDAAVNALTLYEDALFDECDKSYQSGFMDGFQSREEIDDED